MNRLFPIALFALSACASGPQGPDYRGTRLKPAANPSAVIAAELAFATLAQEKGQWTAFRETAADGAQMFVPKRVRAADWLKGRANPAVSVKWQPHAVWSSCDGSYAVTRGGWESPNAAGTFVTIWKRQDKTKYKWIADISLTDDGKVAAPEMIAARVADCKSRAAPPALAPDSPAIDRQDGRSDDATLLWSTSVSADSARAVSISLWTGSAFETVLSHVVPAPEA